MEASVSRFNTLPKTLFTLGILFCIVTMANALCQEGVRYKDCQKAFYAKILFRDKDANAKCSGECLEIGISNAGDCLIWDYECCCAPPLKVKIINGVHNPYYKDDSSYADAAYNDLDIALATDDRRTNSDESDDSNSINESTSPSPSPSPSDDTSSYTTTASYMSDDSVTPHIVVPPEGPSSWVFPDPNDTYREENSNSEGERDVSSNSSYTDTNNTSDTGTDP